MGNHGSHAAGTRSQLHQQQWAHSFPRDLQRVPHLKVLPEGGIGQRLRSTDNGAILNAEGTIRGRRHGSFRRESEEYHGNNGVYRSNSVHRTQYPEDGPLHRSRTQMYRDRDGNTFAVQAKRFGSEPDLRTPPHSNSGEGFGVGAKNRISRGRKKYKAPAPPPVIVQGDGSSPDSYHWELTSGGDTSDSTAPQRRLRLFKTRAETHKHSQNHQRISNEIREERRENSHSNPHQMHRQSIVQRVEAVTETREIREQRPDTRPREIVEPTERRERYTRSNDRFEDRGEGGVMIRGREREVEVRQKARNSAPPVMHRSLSSPEFQAELRAVTQRLRIMDKSKFDRRDKSLDEIQGNNHMHNQKIERDRNNRNDELRRKPEVKKETQNNKMITMDHHNIPARQRLINGFKEVEKKHTKKEILETRKDSRQPKYSRESSQDSQITDGDMSRGQASGKESTPEQSPTRVNEQRKSSDDFKAPSKTFYFGMEKPEQKPSADNIVKPKTVLEKMPNHAIEKLERNLKSSNIENIMAYKIPRQSSSESALSSEPDFEDSQQNAHDISMQLRPTLPKKQLDIPRFSPATAWRLLSVVDSSHYPGNSVHESEEGPVLMEERIERLARPQPTIPLLGQRSSHDKSGDSGISGDAGPTLIEDISEPPPPPIPLPKNPQSSGRPPLVAWTPQQDLEEEASSSDGGLESPKTNAPSDVKFNARSHVFSLSLPRESHLAQYAGSDKSRPNQGFNSLQKLRRSLGAALGNRSRASDEPSPEVDANWFLSTSAPNSLNHTSFGSFRLSRTHSDEEERNTLLDKEPTMLKSPSFTYLANGGHVMYLPSFEKETHKDIVSDDFMMRNKERYVDSKYRDDRIAKVKSIEIPCRKEFGWGLRKVPLSKSCENISSEMRQINRTPSPESNPVSKNSKLHEMDRKIIKGKGKRFTFQSTVRQIERRRIAEKLSKEAERKEKQRLGELEAMRRVEEEFQRKRAREKASIRQQLRLYSLDESNHNVPNNWETHQLRPEPDGAVSSPAPSPTNHTGLNFSKSKDNRTPYVNKIVEQRMSKQLEKNNNSSIENSSMSNKRLETYDQCSSPDISKRSSKNDHRSSPTTRSSEDGRIKTAATEVLSEYRQATREYRDYRGFSRFTLDGAIEQATTVHPQVVYNMPKASHGQSYHEAEGSVSPRSDNYRRDFAHGALPTSSDSELSQPNTRPHSPRHLPRLRARSQSPDCARAETGIVSNSKEPVDSDLINSVPAEDVPKLDQEILEPASATSTAEQIRIEFHDPTQLTKVNLSTLHPQPFVPGKSFKPVTFRIK